MSITTTSTQPYEIRAWLGNNWTEQQITQITNEYLNLERRLQIEPGSFEAQALLTAIAQRVDGTLDPVAIVSTVTQDQARAAESWEMLRAAVRAEVSAGLSESEAARRYNVTRTTVRAWIGK